MKSDFHNRHQEPLLQKYRQRASAPMQRRPQNRESQSALDSLPLKCTISSPSKFVVGHRTDITSQPVLFVILSEAKNRGFVAFVITAKTNRDVSRSLC